MLGGWPALLVGAAIVACIGWWASDRYVKATGREDPPEIVIDEVAAQWLALAVVPVTLAGFLAAFFVFRLFDTLKPWPASWADAEVEGGAGVMLDDLFAGLYSLLPARRAGHHGVHLSACSRTKYSSSPKPCSPKRARRV